MRHRLTEKVKELQYLYDTLNRCHEIINKVEYDANCVEHDYNQLLGDYIKEVGPENLEAGFLEYSTEAVVSLQDDGTFIVTFREHDYNEDEEDSY
jgi:hypothetical protein